MLFGNDLYRIFHLSYHSLRAISKNQTRDYILANLIGKFPSTAFEVAYRYRYCKLPQENMGRLGIMVVVAGVVYFILWKVYKNYINKKKCGTSIMIPNANGKPKIIIN